MGHVQDVEPFTGNRQRAAILGNGHGAGIVHLKGPLIRQMNHERNERTRLNRGDQVVGVAHLGSGEKHGEYSRLRPQRGGCNRLGPVHTGNELIVKFVTEEADFTIIQLVLGFPIL